MGGGRGPAERSRQVERLLWLLVAVVTLAGVVLIGAIVRSGPDPAGTPPFADDARTEPGPSPTGGHRGASEPSGDGTSEEPPPAPPSGTRPAPGEHEPEGSQAAGGAAPGGWSEVARGFGLAFTRTSVGQEAWFAAVSSWLTPEQAAQYADVAIERIPTGTLTTVEIADPGAQPHARATLTYDTGMVLEIGLSYVGAAGGWLVARVSLTGAED